MTDRKGPTIGVARAVEIYLEMVGIRSLFRGDHEPIKMNELWNHASGSNANDIEKSELPLNIRVQEHKFSQNADAWRKATVMALDRFVTLLVDPSLMSEAGKGRGPDAKLANFVLAHEFSHLALDHFAQSASGKNFKLTKRSNGYANLAPTAEELEANMAAVFLLCGPMLATWEGSAKELADRACCDVYSVEKFLRMVRTAAFKEELDRRQSTNERVVL